MKNFIREFNNQCCNIQLESVTIGKTGIFLDLTLEIRNENLISKVYQKPSNKYLYLPPTTNHSKSVMINVIKQELRRYCLYTSNPSDELVIKKNLRKIMLKRTHENLPRPTISTYFRTQSASNGVTENGNR